MIHSHLNSIIFLCIPVCHFRNVVVHTKFRCHEYIRQCKLGNEMHVSEMRKSSMNVSCMITLWILCMIMIIMWGILSRRFGWKWVFHMIICIVLIISLLIAIMLCITWEYLYRKDSWCLSSRCNIAMRNDHDGLYVCAPKTKWVKGECSYH